MDIINIGSSRGSWPYPRQCIWGHESVRSAIPQEGRIFPKKYKSDSCRAGMSETEFSLVNLMVTRKGKSGLSFDGPAKCRGYRRDCFMGLLMPSHVNVNQIEFCIAQAWAPFSVHRIKGNIFVLPRILELL